MKELIASIQIGASHYKMNLKKGIDLSIPLVTEGPNCFYAPLLDIEPVIAGDFIGDRQQGGPLNFKTVRINVHGNGTHTECVGHISKEVHHLPNCLESCFFEALLISVYPSRKENGDRVIELANLQEWLKPTAASFPEALIIRSLPNHDDKKTRNYSGNNPPYFEAAALNYIRTKGVKHLLTDLPSVDKEQDDGKLAGHKAFWNYPENPVLDATITELIYVPKEVEDGFYLLNLHTTSLMLDASPSRPIIFQSIED